MGILAYIYKIHLQLNPSPYGVAITHNPALQPIPTFSPQPVYDHAVSEELAASEPMYAQLPFFLPGTSLEFLKQ